MTARSELQTEDLPRCPNDPTGQGLHCACLDVHDNCCDCPAHITCEGESLCMRDHPMMECCTCVAGR